MPPLTDVIRSVADMMGHGARSTKFCWKNKVGLHACHCVRIEALPNLLVICDEFVPRDFGSVSELI